MGTILDVVKAACDELTLEHPSTLFAAYAEGDTTPAKMRRALRRTVTYLAGDYDWQVLHREKTFTSLASETQTAMIPSDFLRFVDDTVWDRSSQLKLNGPITPADWQNLKAWNHGATVPFFRVRGNDLLTFPVPSAGRTYAFEYITKRIGLNTLATPIEAFSADTDTAYWDDDLMTAGVVLNFLLIERQDSAAAQMDFQKLMADRIKRDGGRRRIQMRSGPGAMSAEQQLQALKSAAVVYES